MEGSGGADKEGAKEKDEIDDKEAKDRKATAIGPKSTTSKLKERWLMTRKTWRYMTDAGKKLFPEGVSPQRSADIPKVQEHFQKTCRKSKEFILWPYQGSLPPDDVAEMGFYQHGSDRRKSRSSTRKSSSVPIPRERRRPANIQPPSQDYFEDDPGGSSSLPCSPTLTNFSQIASDLAWIIEPEIYSQMVRLHGTSYLQKIASRLLEDQLTEVDEYEYEEEEGVELLDINGKRMRSIGAQTDSHLDMCVQTDHDDTAKDRVYVIAETRDEMFERVLKEREDEQRQAETQQQQDQQSQQPGVQGFSRNPNKSKPLQQQQQPQQQQPFQKETPVLKKFWGRRESKGTEQFQPATPGGEKAGRGLASEKDREAPPPKGGVAAKLASLEATSTQPQPKDPTKPKTPQQPAQKNPPSQPVVDKQPAANKSDKKTLKNVFKLGLKCDVESTDPVKKNLEKQNADKFKTVNYDKTLRNIKTKWSKEDDENLRQLLAQQEMCELPRDIPKKKKRSRGIQVGEALPQFILSAFRVSSPVEIFYATRKRIRRRSSKAESTDMSGSEGSVSLASSMPTSPRYSITVADEAGTRNILLSEADALKLSLRGATLYNKRTSLDASFDSADGEGGGPLMGGVPRECPFGVGPGGAPLYQRSMSAHQMSAGVPPSHLLYSGAGGRGAAAAAAAARGHRLSLLQNLLPAVMQRTRTGGGSAAHSSRLVAKRIWRTRSKSQSRASAATTSTWFPTASNEWVSVTGVRVPLEPTSLLQLTELERLTLQRLALARLAALNLGCPINIPKDSSSVSSSKKRRPYLLKRKALTTGFFDSRKEDAKETLNQNSSGGHVFGLSLSKCLENERIRQQQAAELSAAVAATAAATVAATAGAAGLDRSSVGLDRAGGAGGDEPEGGLSRKSSRAGSRASFCSLAEGAKQSSTGSLESLNLDRKRPSIVSSDLLTPAGVCPSDLLQVEPPLAQVPSLVTTCCNHLLQHGLHTVGIFRVSSSKKRVRHLREEFDRLGDVQLTTDHCPHDVATLLKEFFRDLPEPLLSRDLYEPFLKTQKIRNRQLKLEATQHLLQLLPASNRNTLCALLTFLTTVAEHATDIISETGDTIPGNMMDSTNLATMFAPNILHMHRAGAENVSPASLAAMADERTDCINVVRSMINHSKDLFELSAELLNATYHDLMDTHPEALDLMLRRRAPAQDDRGQRLLQQLLASLLQPGRLPPGSPPYSPPHPGLEADIESGGSSVFEGSECSSSLPRSPTEHHGFERLRGGEDGTEGCRTRRREPPSMDGVGTGPHDDSASRRKVEDDGKSSSCAEVPGEDRGWFRRRDKSSSRELDGKGCDDKPQAERSRWFRRRDRTSPRGSIDYGFRRKGSDKKKHEKMLRKEEKLIGLRQCSVERGRRESGSESADSRDHRQRSTSDQTVVQERLRVPEESVRRLSSPEIDGYGVITASLKIPVPLQQQCTSTTFSRDSDIPFIEDSVLAEEARTRRRESSVTSRQRTGSSDSYLGQPITGTMSFQPLCKRDGEKQSHDSVLSSSSADMFTLSPSPRNTPLSDALFASETSSNFSRTTSPPLVLSPDSGTPGLSPPPSPPPPLPRRTRRVEPTTSRTLPVTHSATHTFGSSRSPMVTAMSVRGERGGSQTSSVPITRSRTAEVPTCITSTPGVSDRISNLSREHRDSPPGPLKSSSTSRMIGIETSASAGGDVSSSSGMKRYTRRRPTRQRDGTLDPSTAQHSLPESGSSAQLWKRCEIIASNPGEPESRV